MADSIIIKHIALLSLIFIDFYGAVLLLFTAKKKNKHRSFLAYFFVVSACLFVGHYLSFFGFWRLNRIFDPVFLGSLLAFYPFYYLYIHKAYGYRVSRIKWLVHFVPAILIFVTMSLAIVFNTFEDYSDYMRYNIYKEPTDNARSAFLSGIFNVTLWLHAVQIIGYSLASIRYMRSSYKTLPEFFSNIKYSSLSSFTNMNIAFMICMSLPGLYSVMMGRQTFVADVYQYLMLGFFFSSTYIVLGIVGFKDIPVNTSILNTKDEDAKNGAEDLELAEESHSHLFDRVEALFQKELLWKNPSLNIWDVSKQLKTNRTYISQAINEKKACNFNTYVNVYRVEAAKQLLESEECANFSLEAISEMAGFGSPSTFFRVFKASVGHTPSSYLKSRNHKRGALPTSA